MEAITRICPVCKHYFILIHDNESLGGVLNRIKYLADLHNHFTTCKFEFEVIKLKKDWKKHENKSLK